MFTYARREQCDLGSIYTITNTQRIRIYPGKQKFILSKFHQIQDVYMVNMPKKIKLYSRFLPPDFPVYTSAKYGAYSDLSSYEIYLGKCIYTVI